MTLRDRIGRLAVQPPWAFEPGLEGVPLSTNLLPNEGGCPECGASLGKPCERCGDDEATPAVNFAEGREVGCAPPAIGEAAR